MCHASFTFRNEILQAPGHTRGDREYNVGVLNGAVAEEWGTGAVVFSFIQNLIVDSTCPTHLASPDESGGGR
jgi:hypothetical protein